MTVRAMSGRSTIVRLDLSRKRGDQLNDRRERRRERRRFRFERTASAEVIRLSMPTEEPIDSWRSDAGRGFLGLSGPRKTPRSTKHLVQLATRLSVGEIREGLRQCANPDRAKS